MRVLHVIDSLRTGGAEHSLLEMLPTEHAAGLQPIIVCLRPEVGRSDPGPAQDRDVRWIASNKRTAWIRELRATIRSERPALVHTSLIESDVTGRLAAAGTSVPVLTSLVNTSYDPVRRTDPAVRSWRLALARRVDGWTARNLTVHFHAITHAVKHAAVRDLRIRPQRITVIERGRDPARLGEPSLPRRAHARRVLELRDHHPIVVTVGRQEFQKGQLHLIEAMPKLLASHPDARLLVAGRTGNASGRLRSAVRAAGVDGQIDFLGHRDDVPEILAAADLFVFPSLYEGLGGALIEAMALGLPIVASDLPAIREVVEAGRNALLVPPGSSADLAAAIGALLADEARRTSMGARSRWIFEERFTLERSATRMVQLFERVAAEGRRRNR